jgi:hypothetical protein
MPDSEIPDWLLGLADEPAPDFEDLPAPASPRRSLWDLPIFGAFWGADGADLNR